jgi:biotin carboxyl carrier protein
MQQFEIEVGGRRRQIAVTRPAAPGDRFAVTVDGSTWHVDVSRIGAHTLSLIVDSVSSVGNAADDRSIPSRSIEAVIVPAPAAGQLTIYVGTTPVPVVLNGRRPGRRDERGASSDGPQRVLAPMPGKVVRVLVKSGEAVRARQPLVVVEAMKMENELRAGRDGTVADIHAREGTSVDAGALLVVIQ